MFECHQMRKCYGYMGALVNPFAQNEPGLQHKYKIHSSNPTTFFGEHESLKGNPKIKNTYTNQNIS